MSDQATILVKTADAVNRRAPGARELDVQVVADNINLFLGQVEGILEKAPEAVGRFHLTKLTVSAEISAEGKLILLGSGLQASASGGLQFEFSR